MSGHTMTPILSRGGRWADVARAFSMLVDAMTRALALFNNMHFHVEWRRNLLFPDAWTALGLTLAGFLVRLVYKFLATTMTYERLIQHPFRLVHLSAVIVWTILHSAKVRVGSRGLRLFRRLYLASIGLEWMLFSERSIVVLFSALARGLACWTVCLVGHLAAEDFRQQRALCQG